MGHNKVTELAPEVKQYIAKDIQETKEAFTAMHLEDLKSMVANMDPSELTCIAGMIPYPIILDRLKREMDEYATSMSEIRKLIGNGGTGNGDH